MFERIHKFKPLNKLDKHLTSNTNEQLCYAKDELIKHYFFYHPMTWQILTSKCSCFSLRIFVHFLLAIDSRALVTFYRLNESICYRINTCLWFDHCLTAGGSAKCCTLVDRERIKYKQLYAFLSSMITTTNEYSCEFFSSLLFCPYILEIQMLAIQNKRDKNEIVKVVFVHFPL